MFEYMILSQLKMELFIKLNHKVGPFISKFICSLNIYSVPWQKYIQFLQRHKDFVRTRVSIHERAFLNMGPIFQGEKNL